ncbi:MAG: hypothetical protein ACKOX2_02265 [Microcystaceae cyanobacterium]
MERVNVGGELEFAKISKRESSAARVNQKWDKGEPLINVPAESKPLLTTITDGILQDQGAILIVATAIAISIVIIAGAKAAAEIITACRKK